MHAGERCNQVHIVDLVGSRFLELLHISFKVFNLFFTPFHLILFAIYTNVIFELFEILQEHIMNFGQTVTWVEDWMNHTQVREWERKVQQHRNNCSYIRLLDRYIHVSEFIFVLVVNIVHWNASFIVAKKDRSNLVV